MLLGDYGSMTSSEEENPTTSAVEYKEDKEAPKRKREEEVKSPKSADPTKKTKTDEAPSTEAANDPFAGLVCSMQCTPVLRFSSSDTHIVSLWRHRRQSQALDPDLHEPSQGPHHVLLGPRLNAIVNESVNESVNETVNMRM